MTRASRISPLKKDIARTVLAQPGNVPPSRLLQTTHELISIEKPNAPRQRATTAYSGYEE